MWNFMWKIRNGFLSPVPQKRADSKKDNFVSNEFQPCSCSERVPHIITYVYSLMTVLHVKFHIKIWNGFLSHVPQKRADRKKDNFVSNKFQPPLMFCAGHVTRFFIQYRFIYKSESKFFSQYSQVRVCHLQEFSHIRFTNIFFNSILVITDFCNMFRKADW